MRSAIGWKLLADGETAVVSAPPPDQARHARDVHADGPTVGLAWPVAVARMPMSPGNLPQISAILSAKLHAECVDLTLLEHEGHSTPDSRLAES